MSTTETNWLDVEGAAAHIGMSVAFVRKLVLEHRIRHYKVGRRVRFDPRDLDAFVELGRVEPGAEVLAPALKLLKPQRPSADS